MIFNQHLRWIWTGLDRDAAFVRALLLAKPDKLEEIGSRKVVRFVRVMHRHNTRRFLAQLDDGKMLDISFMKAITNLARAHGSMAG